jgi:hypothetical protein
METLTINIKNKKDSRLIRELLDRLDISIEKEKGKARLGRELPKSKLTPDDLRGMGGILKGQLISLEAGKIETKKSLTPLELKRKSLPKSKFKSKEEFLSYAGSMKGQLISKEHLRNLSWKKRI